ncbi:MAG: adenylosuccinate synthetase, partial [Spirochaetia bacterium]|nr:adenylosuccinate synthetase [Spirochaetia bacterium]
LASMLPDLDNTNDQWQGPVRAGWLDLPLLRYAALLCDGMDGVAVTCLDRIRSLPEIRISQGYSARAESLFNRVDESGLLSAIAEAAGAPVVLTSDRADASGRRLC